MVCSYETISITKWLHFQKCEITKLWKSAWIYYLCSGHQKSFSASYPHCTRTCVNSWEEFKPLEFQVCVKAWPLGSCGCPCETCVSHPKIPVSLWMKWHVMGDFAEIFMHEVLLYVSLSLLESHISFWLKGCQRGHHIPFKTSCLQCFLPEQFWEVKTPARRRYEVFRKIHT